MVQRVMDLVQKRVFIEETIRHVLKNYIFRFLVRVNRGNKVQILPPTWCRVLTSDLHTLCTRSYSLIQCIFHTWNPSTLGRTWHASVIFSRFVTVKFLLRLNIVMSIRGSRFSTDCRLKNVQVSLTGPFARR